MARLDDLLACARLAEPSSAFSASVMVCVAQRCERRGALRRTRRVLSVAALLAAMIAGTIWLLTAMQASSSPLLFGLTRAFQQVGAILRSLAVAARVIVRVAPGEPSVLLAVWVTAAFLVTALWITALAKAQPYRLQA